MQNKEELIYEEDQRQNVGHEDEPTYYADSDKR